MYIAKTSPKVESIGEHTDNLIKNYNLLKDLYEDKIDIDWQVLLLACLYHDLGKTYKGFQEMVRGEKLTRERIPHGYLSACFLGKDKILDLGRERAGILANAIFHHHYRGVVNDQIKDLISKEIGNLKMDANDFKYERLEGIGEDISSIVLRIIKEDPHSEFSQEERKKYLMTKGLLNRIDYAASGHFTIENENNFLISDLEEYKKTWGEDADFNELQKFMLKHQDENVVAVAETGYGKTEAGLLWIGDNKGFFTLPLRSAINSIYDRIRNEIIREDGDISNKLAILHSDSLNEYMGRVNLDEKSLKLSDLQVLDYNEKGRQLTLPLNICTLDQIFDVVYKYQGFESKLASLSYSKIVIDELQMYGADLIAYLIKGLEMVTELGGKFSIITATLPPFILDLLRSRNIEFIEPDHPYFNERRIRHRIKLHKEEINNDIIEEKYEDNKVLVIVNTVKKAQELYEGLKVKYGSQVNLFHSGFIKKDRFEKENRILKFGDKDREESGIWICTQVAEASLDIDFDILITELSDLNGLFQRMGRCYRNRNLDGDEANIIVFDGGDSSTSGIPYVVDEDIFKYSKEGLRSYLGDRDSKKISEEDKLDLINTIYTSERLKGSKYYNEIIRTLGYIDSLYFNENTKSKIAKMFRNINSIDVIPREVYEEYEREILENINLLGEKTSEDNRIEKVKARIYIENLTVSIPYYYTNINNLEELEINKYKKINIYDCQYSEEKGISHNLNKLEEEVKEEVEEVDNFF